MMPTTVTRDRRENLEARRRISAEHDRLRAALRAALEWMDQYDDPNMDEWTRTVLAQARAALAKSRNDVEDNAVRREWDAARYVESEDAAERNCRHDWVENEESGRTYCLTCGQDGDA